MNLQTVANLLSDINDGLMLGKKIYREFVEAHQAVLVDVPDKYYSRIKMQVIKTWKFASLPKPAHLKEVYDSINPPKEESYDNQYKVESEEEKRRWEEKKSKHRVDVIDFVRRIKEGSPLTEKQREAYSLIDKYIRFHGEGRDPKEEIKTLNTPYSLSFTGLYMFFLEGDLKPIKGIAFGDINAVPGYKKPYNEDEFIKEKRRERSLNQEKQRDLGV
jgi:hypothetical protein